MNAGGVISQSLNVFLLFRAGGGADEPRVGPRAYDGARRRARHTARRRVHGPRVAAAPAAHFRAAAAAPGEHHCLVLRLRFRLRHLAFFARCERLHLGADVRSEAFGRREAIRLERSARQSPLPTRPPGHSVQQVKNDARMTPQVESCA